MNEVSFDSLTQGQWERALLPEIIRVMRVLGGQATRSAIREELKNSSEVVSTEVITYEKESKKHPGQHFRPFDFPFYMAINNLVFSGYLKNVSRNTVELTEKGRGVDTNVWNIDADVYALSMPEWKARAKKNKQAKLDEAELSHQEAAPDTVEEEVDSSSLEELDPDTLFQRELHEALMRLSPGKFEEFARRLVARMNVTIDGKLGIKLAGDGGIDGYGYMRSDDFRTTRVAIQAKRWQGSVPAPEIDRFRGAMDKFMAEYGIFITTSDFTKDAVEASRTGTRVITLINGERIAELVKQYELFVHPVTTYELDDEFFADDNE